MVVIFTPIYFDMNGTYCAREFKAMELLEEKRLTLLGKDRNLQHSLIIPVVYRGQSDLPNFLSSERQCYMFESFHVCGKSYLRNRIYQESVKKIAKYIYERCKELESLESDPCNDCGTFELPSKDEIVSWLPSVLPPRAPKFPGRR